MLKSRYLRLWILTVFFCAGHAFCGNQAQNPEVILNRCAQAMGSPQQHFSALAEGQTQNSDSEPSASVRIQTRDLKSFRLETGEREKKSVVTVHRGQGSHQQQDKKQALSRHTTAYFKADHLPALVCGMNLSADGMKATYEGEDRVDSSPVFHLKLSVAPKGKNARADEIESLISEYHLFIDQRSFVVLKTSSFAFSPATVTNHSVWETFYYDYRRVGGVLMPFRMENFLAGQKVKTTTFTNIRTDVSFADQDFQ